MYYFCLSVVHLIHVYLGFYFNWRFTELRRCSRNKRVPSPEISRSWNVSGTPRLYCVVLFGPRVHLAVLSMSEGGLGFVKQGVSFSDKKKHCTFYRVSLIYDVTHF